MRSTLCLLRLLIVRDLRLLEVSGSVLYWRLVVRLLWGARVEIILAGAVRRWHSRGAALHHKRLVGRGRDQQSRLVLTICRLRLQRGLVTVVWVALLHWVLLLCSTSKRMVLRQIELRGISCEKSSCVSWLYWRRQMLLITIERQNGGFPVLTTREGSFVIKILIVNLCWTIRLLLLRHFKPVIVSSSPALFRDILISLIFNTG